MHGRKTHEGRTFACRHPARGLEQPVQDARVGIALSGGGSHGAFTAGIIHTAFSRFLDQDRLPRVAIVSGTSTGSLVAGLLVNLYGRYRLGEQPRRALDDLEHVYTRTEQEEVGKVPRTVVGKVANLILKKGVMDIAPLRKLVARYYSERHFEAARSEPDPVVFSADVIDMPSGLPVRYNSDAGHPREQMIDAIFASCAQPVVMTPAYIGDRWCVDGGVREVVPFREALYRGCTHVLAIALNEPRIDADGDMTRENDDDIFGRIERGLSVMNDEVARDDERMARMVAYINRVRDALVDQGVSQEILEKAFGEGPLPPDEKPLKKREHDPYDDGAYNSSRLRQIDLFRFEQQKLPSQEAFDPVEMRKLFDQGKKLALEKMGQIESCLFAAGEFRRTAPQPPAPSAVPPAPGEGVTLPES